MTDAATPSGPAPGLSAGVTPGDAEGLRASAGLLPDGSSAAGSLIERMGIRISEAGAARAVATMPVQGNTQPYGLLHGGASAVLAETLGSYAAAMHAGPGRIAVGVELNATHHRAVRQGQVTGIATALHLGGTVATYAIEVRDDADRLVCTARLSCLLRAAAPGHAA